MNNTPPAPPQPSREADVVWHFLVLLQAQHTLNPEEHTSHWHFHVLSRDCPYLLLTSSWVSFCQLQSYLSRLLSASTLCACGGPTLVLDPFTAP